MFYNGLGKYMGLELYACFSDSICIDGIFLSIVCLFINTNIYSGPWRILDNQMLTPCTRTKSAILSVLLR